MSALILQGMDPNANLLITLGFGNGAAVEDPPDSSLGSILTGGLGPALPGGGGPGREMILLGYGGDPSVTGSTGGVSGGGATVWVARLGDPSDHGGTIISGCASTVLTNGKQTALDGCLHSCPIDDHGVTPVSATGVHTAEGAKIVRVGDKAGCGAAISKGSPNVASK